MYDDLIFEVCLHFFIVGEKRVAFYSKDPTQTVTCIILCVDGHLIVLLSFTVAEFICTFFCSSCVRLSQ